jgi:hypothetical protein
MLSYIIFIASSSFSFTGQPVINLSESIGVTCGTDNTFHFTVPPPPYSTPPKSPISHPTTISKAEYKNCPEFLESATGPLVWLSQPFIGAWLLHHIAHGLLSDTAAAAAHKPSPHFSRTFTSLP